MTDIDISETTSAADVPWQGGRSRASAMMSKVPEVTAYFWGIKVLCTTVGETAADYLNTNLNFGLTNTSYVMSALLLLVLVVQFRVRRYVPVIYWLAVVLISVVGTLVSDNLTDNLNVPLTTTTPVFAVALAITFAAWYLVEGTLSIHSVRTTRREFFYWLTILFTFALGTSAGDLVAERMNVGYLLSVALFAGVIALIAGAHYLLRLNAVLAFWLAYIVTRPLGASVGDYLSSDRSEGGLGLGTTGTSALFLTAILGLVVYLSITGRDREQPLTP
ncbi:hypothetical protein [Actinospica sp.]|uniref:COG4705 family protein n=1 Tax=Actinospica sp. TaxID=1872142 RepID=UPI002C3699F1|nr:hypothetical protein [Actinospica sp.]HWG26369.1 hypothetical protein [Actinospica sp.]